MDSLYAVLLAIVAAVAGYFKLVVIPKKKVKKAYKELGAEKNKAVGKKKEDSIADAKKDHDSAVSSDTNDWVDKWLK